MPDPKFTIVARASAAAAIMLAAAGAGAASARPSTPILLPPTAMAATVQPCLALVAPATLAAAKPVSKAAAILGGQGSALDAIRRQQGGFPGSPAAPALARAASADMTALAPAARMAPLNRPCAQAPSFASSRRLGPDDYLGSRRVAIGRTHFDADWRRVKAERVGLARELQRMIGGAADRTATLGAVNRWVNREIAYVEDRELFRRGDYWAGAKRTLRLRQGDCEDIAIAKMQLLAAAGVPRADMVLTIARDPVRRADHAVLIVRSGGGYVMLDNTTDLLLDARQDNEYRPVLSLGESRSWLHGY